MESKSYDTLVEAINDLTKKGYTSNLNAKSGCLVCNQLGVKAKPEEFVIDSFYRFEGESNPDDSSILYAISSEEHNMKGLLVNAFGIYSDDFTDALIQKLNI